MDKASAIKTAIEITNTYLCSCELKVMPYKDSADNIADFIETLAARLEKLEESTPNS